MSDSLDLELTVDFLGGIERKEDEEENDGDKNQSMDSWVRGVWIESVVFLEGKKEGLSQFIQNLTFVLSMSYPGAGGETIKLA